MSVPLLILTGWLVMALLMAGLWLVQRRTRNAGIVDVAWSFGTGLLAVWFALMVDGDPQRRLLVALLAGLWSVRLGMHLLVRVMSEKEDGRYRMMRERLGGKAQPVFFAFFQIQAIWAVMFAMPMLVAASNTGTGTGLQWHDAAGILIWIVAITGQRVADRQLAAFRNAPENKGRVCDRGLWRYSRHPNYFFEWTHWFAYVLIAIGSPWWWVPWAGVLIMLLFLTKITGIPYTEMRAIQSRGDAYRHYQQTTSAFFPWPPRRLATTPGKATE